ncbi:MAG: hypothetical protein ABFD98_15770 [Syntrophobacteraceae bacterium]|nr:hypothetical protein [Desulfobacteraceae bacterium]
MKTVRSYRLRNLKPENVRRSLGGAAARANKGVVVLQIQTKEGCKVPKPLVDGVPDSRNFSYIEGYLTKVDEESYICLDVAHEGGAFVSEVGISPSAIDYCFVNFEERKEVSA